MPEFSDQLSDLLDKARVHLWIFDLLSSFHSLILFLVTRQLSEAVLQKFEVSFEVLIDFTHLKEHLLVVFVVA